MCAYVIVVVVRVVACMHKRMCARVYLTQVPQKQHANSIDQLVRDCACVSV